MYIYRTVLVRRTASFINIDPYSVGCKDIGLHSLWEQTQSTSTSRPVMLPIVSIGSIILKTAVDGNAGVAGYTTRLGYAPCLPTHLGGGREVGPALRGADGADD